MFKGISRSLPPLAAVIFLASFLFASHSSAYAIIDLDPGGAPRANPASSTEPEAQGLRTVEGNFRQKGHLLALVPVSFEIKIKAHASGELELDYPWYSFMTLSRRKEITTKLKVAIDSARRQEMVGSVRADGEQADPQFTPAEAAIVAAEIERVLAEEFPKTE